MTYTAKSPDFVYYEPDEPIEERDEVRCLTCGDFGYVWEEKTVKMPCPDCSGGDMESKKPVGDPNCVCCHGEGVRFWHLPICTDDDCALAGGINDCDGSLQECPCVNFDLTSAVSMDTGEES